MLNLLIENNRLEIITRTRAKAAARMSSPAEKSVDHDQGIPMFLDQLSDTLRHARSGSRAMDDSATQRGAELLRIGYTVSQVVHGYGDVCQAVTELALESDTSIGADDFRVFNGCLDDAIASAVTEYERQRENAISRQGAERLGTLTHELRNALSTALLTFGALSRGQLGVESSTGKLLHRSLIRLRDLIDRSLSEVRLQSGLFNVQRLSVADVVQDVAIVAAADAEARGLHFAVSGVNAGLEVAGDRHLLIGALENIVQNAFKFTHSGGHVTLTVSVSAGEILFEVEDECGGLESSTIAALFGAFEQRGADRTGLGLGLWISKTSVETMGGRLFACDLPGKGCTFTIGLPSIPPA